eukprot:scaffold675_cov103-Cylindrotheca_fusiformis.AAC.18
MSLGHIPVYSFTGKKAPGTSIFSYEAPNCWLSTETICTAAIKMEKKIYVIEQTSHVLCSHAVQKSPWNVHFLKAPDTYREYFSSSILYQTSVWPSRVSTNCMCTGFVELLFD